jgi:hypothetical protein
MVVFSDGCTFDLLQFFVFAKEEESLGNEFALAKGKRVPYQETMVIEYILCLNMFPLIREYTRSSIGWETSSRAFKMKAEDHLKETDKQLGMKCCTSAIERS